MRKLISMVVMCTITVTTLFAQQNKYDIGLHAGPSLTTYWGFKEDFDYVTHRAVIKMGTGMFFQYNLPKIISIRTEINYERKGYYAEGVDWTFRKTTMLVNAGFLTLPLLCKATFGNKVKFFINAGPFLGYLPWISVEKTARGFSYGAPSANRQPTFDRATWFKKWDGGIVSGLGITYPIGDKLYLSCELRNSLGLYNTRLYRYMNQSYKTNATTAFFGMAYKIGTRK